jgi:maleate isomerase
MFGWRARIGFLVPPGNPTVEPEMASLTPPGVTLHFTRMVAHGVTGSLQGQEERNRTQIAHLDENIALLAMVKPDVIVLAHTATSYTLGRAAEEALIRRIGDTFGIPLITAFGSVVAALGALGASRVAVGTPYDDDATRQCKANLEERGFAVVACERLEGVVNIYDETAERAYRLARKVCRDDADAVFLSGVGMPTLATLDLIERDVGKPAVSSAAAMMWNALRTAGLHAPIEGYGRLLALRY